MPENKVKFGLENVYYAVATDTGAAITYGTPKPIIGAVNLTLNPSGESVKFYADNKVFFEEESNEGYEGSLEMALVSDEFKVDVFGYTIDSNGAIIENADAVAKKFALMYEIDGDLKKARRVNYYLSAARPSVEGSTKTASKDPKTESMNITARPSPYTKDVKAKLYAGQTGYDTFFSAVYEKNGVVNTAAATATFSKAAPADVTINTTSSDATNTAKNVMIDGVNIGGVNLTVTGVDVTIASAFVAALDNGTYTLTVEFVKGNAVTVALTVAA